MEDCLAADLDDHSYVYIMGGLLIGRSGWSASLSLTFSWAIKSFNSPFLNRWGS